MINKKFISILIIGWAFLSYAGYVQDYQTTLILPDGTKANLVPVTNTEKDRASLHKILKDKDTTSTMRDLKPWTDPMIDGTFSYYASSWITFEDLQKIGIKPKNPTFGFLAYTPEGKIMGFAGIQRSTRGQEHNEIFFAILPPYRQKRLGTAMATFILNFYQKEYGKIPMEAIVLPTNKASQALLKKIGFKPLLDKVGKIITHLFARWNNTTYQVYRYTPQK